MTDWSFAHARPERGVVRVRMRVQNLYVRATQRVGALHERGRSNSEGTRISPTLQHVSWSSDWTSRVLVRNLYLLQQLLFSMKPFSAMLRGLVP